MAKGKRSRNGQGSIYETTFTDKRTGKKVTRWQAQVVIPQELGESKRRTLYGKTYAEVKEKLDTLQRQIADGTVANTAETVAQYLERWLKETERSVQPTTFGEYQYCVHNHITPRIGSKRLDKVTPLQVQTLIGGIADTIASKSKGRYDGNSTANKCRVVLFMAFKQAIRWQLVARNPVEAVDPLPEEKRDMILWEPEQAAKFLDVAREHRLYAAFYVAMSAGLRRAELLGLRWKDVEGQLLHVRQTLVKRKDGSLMFKSTKSGKSRVVAISPDVTDVLEQHRLIQQAEREHLGEAWGVGNLQHDLVFTSEVGTPVNPDNMRRVRKALMNKAGVPHVRLHDLRHLHSSVCIKNGMDPKMLADRLGHARASFTLDRYTHLFDSQRATSAVSLLDFLPKADPESIN